MCGRVEPERGLEGWGSLSGCWAIGRVGNRPWTPGRSPHRYGFNCNGTSNPWTGSTVVNRLQGRVEVAGSQPHQTRRHIVDPTDEPALTPPRRRRRTAPVAVRVLPGGLQLGIGVADLVMHRPLMVSHQAEQLRVAVPGPHRDHLPGVGAVPGRGIHPGRLHDSSGRYDNVCATPDGPGRVVVFPRSMQHRRQLVDLDARVLQTGC